MGPLMLGTCVLEHMIEGFDGMVALKAHNM